jgi:CheY-like chemotaxis protein
MYNNILVVDDDTLMRPSLALYLEQAGHWRSRAAGSEAALTLMEVYPPEVIFLTARRTKLDQVLGLERGADNNVARLFDLDRLLARIRATFAALVASVAARWRQIWVPTMFALGVLLLVLAAPHWTGWVQALATYELPTEDLVGGWLTHLLFDPVTTFNSLLSGAAQTWLNPAGQMDGLVTLAIIVLAVASVAGLAQLLGDEHKVTLPGA